MHLECNMQNARARLGLSSLSSSLNVSLLLQMQFFEMIQMDHINGKSSLLPLWKQYWHTLELA